MSKDYQIFNINAISQYKVKSVIKTVGRFIYSLTEANRV